MSVLTDARGSTKATSKDFSTDIEKA